MNRPQKKKKRRVKLLTTYCDGISKSLKLEKIMILPCSVFSRGNAHQSRDGGQGKCGGCLAVEEASEQKTSVLWILRLWAE